MVHCDPVNGSSGRLDCTYIRPSSHVTWVSRERAQPFPFPLSRNGASVLRRVSSYRRLPYKAHGSRRHPKTWTHWDSNPGHPPCKGGTLPLSYGPTPLRGVNEPRWFEGARSASGTDRKVSQGVALVSICGGDPAADSPTATLLRLKPPCEAQIRPGNPGLIRTSLGCFDGRCVQGAGTYSPRACDTRLLPNPASCGRVSAHNPNYDQVCEITVPSRGRNPLS